MKISLVIPVYNESEVLSHTKSRLDQVLNQFSNKEIIFVDDASTDNTLELISHLRRQDPNVKFIALEKNAGQQAAFEMGMRYVSGDVTVLMDADLQDPPELIPEMVNLWSNGFHVVATQRKSRNNPGLRSFLYDAYYDIVNSISPLKVLPKSGDFCLYDRSAVRDLLAFKENRKVFRILRSRLNAKQSILKYDEPARYAGESKYTFSKLLDLAFSGLWHTGGLRNLLLGSYLMLGFTFLLEWNTLFFFFGVSSLLLTGQFAKYWRLSRSSKSVVKIARLEIE